MSGPEDDRLLAELLEGSRELHEAAWEGFGRTEAFSKVVGQWLATLPSWKRGLVHIGLLRIPQDIRDRFDPPPTAGSAPPGTFSPGSGPHSSPAGGRSAPLHLFGSLIRLVLVLGIVSIIPGIVVLRHHARSVATPDSPEVASGDISPVQVVPEINKRDIPQTSQRDEPPCTAGGDPFSVKGRLIAQADAARSNYGTARVLYEAALECSYDGSQYIVAKVVRGTPIYTEYLSLWQDIDALDGLASLHFTNHAVDDAYRSYSQLVASKVRLAHEQLWMFTTMVECERLALLAKRSRGAAVAVADMDKCTSHLGPPPNRGLPRPSELGDAFRAVGRFGDALGWYLTYFSTNIDADVPQGQDPIRRWSNLEASSVQDPREGLVSTLAELRARDQVVVDSGVVVASDVRIDVSTARPYDTLWLVNVDPASGRALTCQRPDSLEWASNSIEVDGLDRKVVGAYSGVSFVTTFASLQEERTVAVSTTIEQLRDEPNGRRCSVVAATLRVCVRPDGKLRVGACSSVVQ